MDVVSMPPFCLKHSCANIPPQSGLEVNHSDLLIDNVCNVSDEVVEY